MAIADSTRSTRIALAACLLFGLVMRLLFTITLPGTSGDSATYEALAWNLASHFEYSTSPEPPYRASFDRTPGYPVFMAAIFSLAGHSQVAVRVAQALLDTLTVFVIYLLARRACRIASPVLAPGLAAVLPFTAIYAAYLLSEALATFASAVTLLIAIAALGSDRWSRFLATGLCLGILVLIRPDFALLPVAAVFYFAITLSTARRRTLLPIALISIGCLARAFTLGFAHGTRTYPNATVVSGPMRPSNGIVSPSRTQRSTPRANDCAC